MTMQSYNGKTLLFYGFMIMLLLGFRPSYALSAEATVKKFYDNVASKRCFDAVKLRPDYSLDSCENIDKIYVHKIKLKAEDQYHAVVLVELDVEMQGKNTYFHGHTLLKNNNKKWFIVGPYKSDKTFNTDEYIAEYIPQGLHAKGEYKKPIEVVKPKKQASSVHELPPGDAVDASVSTSTAPSSSFPTTTRSVKPESVKQEEKQLPQKLQQLTLKGAKPLQHNKEMNDYFLGNIAIQGNFVGLVDNIRSLFPELAQHVILVDKSQSTLYFYKEKNELAGFFPVLTAAVADFPSGLYQIDEEGEGNGQEIDSKKDLEKNSKKQVVGEGGASMKKLELDSEQQLLISGYYYLRNYFDKNQKQSLSLSPIDNKKLQQLITTETLVYIAE